jgi:hypothetical protein
MAAHKGPASLRPRCTRSGSSVARIPVYQSTSLLRTHRTGGWKGHRTGLDGCGGEKMSYPAGFDPQNV